jgi:hypothetical protein
MSNAYIYCMYVLMFLSHEHVFEKSVDVCLIALYISDVISIYFMLSLYVNISTKDVYSVAWPDLGGRGC